MKPIYDTELQSYLLETSFKNSICLCEIEYGHKRLRVMRQSSGRASMIWIWDQLYIYYYCQLLHFKEFPTAEIGVTGLSIMVNSQRCFDLDFARRVISEILMPHVSVVLMNCNMFDYHNTDDLRFLEGFKHYFFGAYGGNKIRLKGEFSLLECCKGAQPFETHFFIARKMES